MNIATAKSSGSAFLSFGKKLRPTLDRWISRQSLIPTTPTLDPTLFSWTERLQANWLAIQKECDFLLGERDTVPPLGELASYHRRIAPDNKWRSFFFEMHGYAFAGNRARCPNTVALLDTIPGLVTAFYSVMDSGTHVPQHKGITKALLNLHLGLRVPAGCRIHIAKQDHGWEEGKFLVIDDTYPHEVWNDVDRSRAVLFIQVMRPMRLFGRLLGKAIVEAVTHTKYIQQARRSVDGTRGPRLPNFPR